MNRRSIGASLILGTFIALGCNSPQRAEKEAREAQQRADEEAAKARAQAEHTASQAQANANDQIREADRVLAEKKADFQQSKQKELDDLNHRIDEVRTKATTAKTDVKVAVDAALTEAGRRRADVDADLRALEIASAADLDRVEGRIDQDLSLFRKSVSEAEKKI